MSELKAFVARNIDDGTCDPVPCVEVYLKSEADKVIAEKDKKIDLYKRGFEENDKINAYLYAEPRHSKYKRCLAMAKLCGLMSAFHNGEWYTRWINRWYYRWMELADKFKDKEAK